MNPLLNLMNGKKTLLGLVGFIGCRVLARVLPEAGEACEILADYVFAPLAGLGAWHKLTKLEGTSSPLSRAPRGGGDGAPPPTGTASYERFGKRRPMPGLLLAAALGAMSLTGCASLQGRGLAAGIADAAKQTLEAAAEEANLKKHLREFFETVGDLLFGEEELEVGE